MGSVALTEVAGVGRQAFARLLAQRGYTFGVEVGVERGVHAKGLCQRIPGLTLYCIDPWRCVPGYRDHVPQERLDSFYEETRKRLAPYTPYIWREASLDAVGFFKEYEVDFVYLDGDHRPEAVRADVEAWLPKVRPGGALCGHDYDEVAESIDLSPLTVYGDAGHARTWLYEVS